IGVTYCSHVRADPRDACHRRGNLLERAYPNVRRPWHVDYGRDYRLCVRGANPGIAAQLVEAQVELVELWSFLKPDHRTYVRQRLACLCGVEGIRDRRIKIPVGLPDRRL